MSALAPARVGWCPGALAPMASGDGLIVRIKPRGGRLRLEQARAIALASKAYGNGGLDLTARANLQIRGLREEALPGIVETLDGAGLLDPSPAAEAARNVVSSPLAGFDPAAIFDIRPAVRALEARLIEDAALHAVPAKFSFVVDDGGRLGLADVSADIRFEAFLNEATPAFAVRLGGAEDEAAGLCGTDDIAHAAAALVGVFLRARAADGDLCRMRHLTARVGAPSILRRAGLRRCSSPARRHAADSSDFIGTQDSRQSSDLDGWERPLTVGVAAPFGRLTADQLDVLAQKAGQCGAAELRLTPWRAILVPGLLAEAASDLAQACGFAGLVVDPADPRLWVAACTGAPGCHRGTTPVLDDAARLSARLGLGRSGRVILHVSGCSKGCAHAGKAPMTLVAENGRYNLVVDGRASDRPILHGLGFEEAAEWVKASVQRERQS